MIFSPLEELATKVSAIGILQTLRHFLGLDISLSSLVFWYMPIIAWFLVYVNNDLHVFQETAEFVSPMHQGGIGEGRGDTSCC
jgi:hypothetical protein